MGIMLDPLQQVLKGQEIFEIKNNFVNESFWELNVWAAKLRHVKKNHNSKRGRLTILLDFYHHYVYS